MASVSKAMSEFSNRIRWKAAFRIERNTIAHGDDDMFDNFINPRYSGKPCARFSRTRDPEIEMWLDGLNNAVYGKCIRMLSTAHRHISGGHSSALLRLGFRILKTANGQHGKQTKTAALHSPTFSDNLHES